MFSFDLSNPKLHTLAEYEGFADVIEFLEANSTDSVVPAICVNEDCNAVDEMEPDQDRGFCDECGTQTKKSALVLAGVI